VTVALIGERNLDNVNHLPTEEAFERLSVETEPATNVHALAAIGQQLHDKAYLAFR